MRLAAILTALIVLGALALAARVAFAERYQTTPPIGFAQPAPPGSCTAGQLDFSQACFSAFVPGVLR